MLILSFESDIVGDATESWNSEEFYCFIIISHSWLTFLFLTIDR